MEEVKWMLARNSVNIRYLDILSNEFAAASKDPTQGFEPCSLDALLEEVANLMNQIAPEKVEASLSLPPSMPRLVCHGGALRRLLMNLTLNAVDAFFGGSVTEKGRIDLIAGFDEDKEEFRITVRDNGPGIPENILGNLRRIFEQVQASADALGEIQNIAEQVRSTKDQGFKEHYGLGFLFVCQTVNAHQGQLEINSAPGKGARFDIIIPRRTAATSPGTVAEE
jgi:signal transduction histidine kinase